MSAAGDGRDFVFDVPRAQRLGFGEAVFCAGKTPAQLAAILAHAAGRGASLLLTRLDEARFAALPEAARAVLNYDPLSRTAFAGPPRPVEVTGQVAVVTAGTSDLPVAREAVRTLRFEGVSADEFADIGVAGLWRLMQRLDELRPRRVIIVAAGMDAALPTVLGGLVPGLVIGLPTSVGYGVATGGRTALGGMLASCAPGIVVVNIDNGYGAACAALRALGRGAAAAGRE